MKPIKITLLLCLLFVAIQLSAQRFKGAIIIGANMSELDGGEVDNRIGPTFGFGIMTQLNNRWELNLELMYTQNGFYLQPDYLPSIEFDKLKLHFLEFPLQLHYLFNIKNVRKERKYKGSLNFGVAYAQLIDHKAIADDGTNISDELLFEQEKTWLGNFGVTAFWNEHLGINSRGSLSMHGDWTIALRMIYVI